MVSHFHSNTTLIIGFHEMNAYSDCSSKVSSPISPEGATCNNIMKYLVIENYNILPGLIMSTVSLEAAICNFIMKYLVIENT